MSDEFWKQFFTFAGIVVIQIIGLVTLVLTKRNNQITKENAVKLDDAANKVEEAKTRVEEVHSLANGRLTAALSEIESLRAENARLLAEVGHRRATDA